MLFHFLLEGVKRPDFGEYSYTSIKKNADVAALPTPLQNKLVHFIQREMSRDPENRSQTVAELMAAMKPLIDALSQPYYLVPNPPSAIAEDQFLGREKQLCELGKLLQAHNFVFLSGVGGIGKSELAAQFARRQQDMPVLHATYSAGNPESKDNIDRSGLKQLILSLPIVNYPAPPQPPKLDDLENLADAQRRNYPQERKDYYDKKLTQLRALCRENVLMIVDNFNVDSDEGLEDLESLGCKTILTTWCDYQSLYPDQQLTLENSNAEDWTVDLFCRQTKRPLNRDKVREIVRRVEYHTTAVILLGAQLQADYMDEATLLERLNHSLSDAGTANVPFHKDGTARRDQRSFAYLQAIFDMAKLDEAEQQLLIKLSFLSAQPFTMDMLRKWEPELDMNAFNQLVTYRWISEDQYPTFHLPQVVADVVFESAGEKVMGALEFVERIANWCNDESIEDELDFNAIFATKADELEDELVEEAGKYAWENYADKVQRALHHIRKNFLGKIDNEAKMSMAACYSTFARLYMQDDVKAGAFFRCSLELYHSVTDIPSIYAFDLALVCLKLGVLLNIEATLTGMWKELWEIGNGPVGSQKKKEIEAEDLFQEALEISRKLLKEQDSDENLHLYLSCCMRIAGFYEVKKPIEAEKYYYEALHICNKKACNYSGLYLNQLETCFNRLFYFLKSQNKTPQLDQLYYEGMNICRQLDQEGIVIYERAIVELEERYNRSVRQTDERKAEDGDNFLQKVLEIIKAEEL